MQCSDKKALIKAVFEQQQKKSGKVAGS